MILPGQNILFDRLGLKPLNKAWAKAEIFLGLCFVYLGLVLAIPSGGRFLDRPFGFQANFWGDGLMPLLLGAASFVLGGYLAMAGHRSHLYQSNNMLTSFVIEEIRKIQEKE